MAEAESQYASFWGARKAIREVTMEHRKRMQKYHRAINLVTSDAAPFAPSWKEHGKWLYARLSGPYFEQLQIRLMNEHWGKGKSLLDADIDKSPPPPAGLGRMSGTAL